MKIAVCAKNYPSPARPHQAAFLQALVGEFVQQGAEVVVVSPQPLSLGKRDAGTGTCEAAPLASVIRTRFPSLSVRRLGPVRFARMTSRLFRGSAHRGFQSQGLRPDVFYGHFLFLGGEAAVSLGSRYGVPSVIALGESDMTRYEGWFGLEFVREAVAAASGLIAVSPAIRDYCEEVLNVPAAKILLAPNGVDCEHFRPHARDTARRALGLALDQPIVSFVGHFTERKGPNRVLEALSLARSKPLGVFMGTGPLKPSGPNVMHAGPVSPRDLPTFLNASDVFILPTLAEGSCNAILEALACGIPVVSSDIPAIRDDFGPEPPMFLADPRDSGALAAQLDRVLELPGEAAQLLRSKARKLAEARSLTARAATILNWLEQVTSRPESC